MIDRCSTANATSWKPPDGISDTQHAGTLGRAGAVKSQSIGVLG
jgi:hypothetical protein